MKARVKATGDIVEVVKDGPFYNAIDGYERYYEHELDFQDMISYWEKLLHQYAGMAMQGLMSYIEQVTPTKGCSYCDAIVDFSVKVAHALVEKMKEEK